jgi:hypothetical protein
VRIIVTPAVPLAVTEDPFTLAERTSLCALVKDVMGRAEDCDPMLLLDALDPRIGKPA